MEFGEQTRNPRPKTAAAMPVSGGAAAGVNGSHRRFAPQIPHLSMLGPLYEVNERCIEMLVQGARVDRPGTLSLISHLRDLLRGMTPEMRARAACRAVLLIDMQFANLEWWRAATDHPTRPAPLPSWRGAFPRPAGVQLARATLMLAWHSVRSDPDAVCLLGMVPAVAEVIASLSLTEIDRVVERRFRHVRPRWEDRPAVWRGLLLSAQKEDVRRTRDFNLYSLQLLTGELLSPPVPTKVVR
jgi:hypothetical protein